MSGQIFSFQDNRKFITPSSAGISRQKGVQQDLASQTLALSGLLQTTLVIEELIPLFFKQLNRVIAFDGIHFQKPDDKIDVGLGIQIGHSCSYQLQVATEELGTLDFIRRSPFSDDDLHTIESLLAGTLYPLRNALLYHKAQRSAMLDPLTGAGNRTAMDSTMHREIELARRYDIPLSIILLDIDHFKGINDNYGHLHGDTALQEVARCANKTIRDSDLLFRFGGEEFLILLNNTGPEGAYQLAERIRNSIEMTSPIPSLDLRITASFGVSTLNDDDDTQTLFKRVDDALYRAKENGRNRVVIC
ncbi:MAG: GGDEF domain-containing protein [Sedimenticola sp.]